MITRLVAAASLALGLAGCSAPEHDNPFDPQTPPALQARATLRGTVALEQLGDVPPALEGVNVSVAGVGAAVTNAAGEWLLPEVVPGTYSVQTLKEGYETVEVGGIVVRLDDGGQDVWVTPIAMEVARGTIAGFVQLSAGAVDGFQPGADRSGVVVTLSGTGIPLPAAVSDASGAYRFVGVPATVGGAAYTVSASKPFHLGAETTATVGAHATTTVPLLTLEVDPASASGAALLWDNVADGGANPTSAGVDVSLSGTAFNGTAFSRSTTTLADGTFSLAPLPAGTYDVVASSESRACGAFARVTVLPGDAVLLGTVGCVDAVAPGSVVLGDPVAPAGGESGYTRFDAVAVPIAVQAGDDTLPASNFAGYQTFVGPVANWDEATPVAGTPALLAFTGLVPNVRNTLWARGVDWAGNAGPAASVQVVQDDVPPRLPTISTPRAFVDATTTSVTLSGGEKDANFSGYQTCTETVGVTEACPVATPCTFADAPSASFALSLVAGQRTCLYARSVDRAGNASFAASASVVSDLQPPLGPSIAPLFDPTSLRVAGEYVDFRVTAPATDGLTGDGAAWRHVAWIEVDTGNGFVPLCPSASCRPDGVYSPCDPACSCSDPARLCRGAELVGVRLPLAANRDNEIAVRAVDLAGNVGSGASQQVVTRQNESLIQANPGTDESPRVRGRVLVFTSQALGYPEVRMTDLGVDGIPSLGDATCSLGGAGAFLGAPKGEAALGGTVAYTDTPRYLAVSRRGPDGVWCTADDARTQVHDLGAAAAIWEVSASPDASGKRERAAFSQYDTATWGGWAIKVVEPGLDGQLGPGDAVIPLASLGATRVFSLHLAGDALLFQLETGAWTVLNAGPLGFGAATTSWALPSTAVAAGLSGDGRTLAWIDDALPPRLVVKSAGANGDFEALDPEIALQGVGPALGPYGAEVAVEGVHVAVTERGLVNSSTYAVHHWSAGGDGAFGTTDDTYARILPSSRPRSSPSLSGGIAGGILYYTIGRSGMTGEDPDILATDLTATRWEVAAEAAVRDPRPNGAGTLFFKDTDQWLCARTSDGRETRAGAWTNAFAADGDRLYYASGSALMVARPDATGQFFTAAAPPDALAHDTGGPWYTKLEARDGVVFAETWKAPSGYELSVVTWDGASATSVRVDDSADFAGITGHHAGFGLGISSLHAAWGCSDGGYYYPCVRSSVNGVFGDGDDVSAIPFVPSTAMRFVTTNIHVVGNKLVLTVSSGADMRLLVIDAGPDQRFNTGDEIHVDLGALRMDSVVSTDAAGDFVAWSDFVAGLGGTQIRLLDMRDGSVRTLTDWYSFKPEVRVEPSGRIYWVDQVFQADAIFVRTP